MRTSKESTRWAVISFLLVLTFFFTLQTGSAGARQPSDEGRIIKRVKIVAPAVTTKKVSKPPLPEKEKTVKPPATKPVVKKPVVKPLHKKVVKKQPRKPVHAVVSKKRAQKKDKVETKVAAAKSGDRGEWAINVASYVSKEDALRFAQKLRGAGYSAYTVEFDYRGVHWHRLRVGFYATRDEAKSVAQNLSQQFDIEGAWVVKPTVSEVNAHGK